jgi:serine/threonine-protein kinase RsbW
MPESPNVALTLSNTPQNVSLVREMLFGVADVAELDRGDLDDVRTAVTEACNNVALHAYVGARGPLEVDVYTHPDALDVVVRDRGIGFPPELSPAGANVNGLGLHMMRALTNRLELCAAPGRGSEARMTFATPGARGLGFADPDRTPSPIPAAGLGFADPSRTPSPISAPAASEHALQAAIAPNRLAAPVLRRLLSGLAAYAHFSTDRIADVQLLTDTLATDTPADSARPFSLAVDVEPRELHLQIGPLDSGVAQGMIANSHLQGSLIEQLTDARQVTSVGRCEVLSLRLLDRRR